MNNCVMNTPYPDAPRPILPPPEARSTAQRIFAANQEWRDVMDAARGYDGKCVANGTRLFLNLSRFFHELIDNDDLRGRVIQHLQQRICDDFPPAQGKLL